MIAGAGAGVFTTGVGGAGALSTGVGGAATAVAALAVGGMTAGAVELVEDAVVGVGTVVLVAVVGVVRVVDVVGVARVAVVA